MLKVDGILQHWFPAYAGTAVSLGVFGLATRRPLLDAALANLPKNTLTPDAISTLSAGTYLGVAATALLFPLLIPWLLAMVSKLISFFVGSRLMFSDFFRVYQWGTFASTVLTITVKGALFVALPVSAWGKVSLSLGLFLPHLPRFLAVLLQIMDVPQILLYLTALALVYAVKKQRNDLYSVVGAWLTAIGFQLCFVSSMIGG